MFFLDGCSFDLCIQVRLIQTACQAPRKELQSAELVLSGSQQAQKIVLGFSR